jgi:hypothetical protein
MDRRGSRAVRPRHGSRPRHRAGGRGHRLIPPASIGWLSRRIAKGLRIFAGILLILGGLLGFLPILGFWMLPLGVLMLARDIPAVARWVERLKRWWHARRRQEKP